MASNMCIFNAKKFYEVLASSQNIADKLQTLKVSCDKGNIQYIFSAVNVLHEVLDSTKELPLTKYNALFTAYQIFQTANYIALSLLEIYILPLLRQIALVNITKRSEEELQRYFIEQGFRQSVGIRIVGRKYVLLAAQIVFSIAAVRPNFNILHTEIATKSKSRDIFQELRSKGGIQEQKFNNLDLQIIRKKYQKSLKKFDPSQLAGFLGKTLKQQIVFNNGLTNSFKKLIESEDCFISIPIINTCISLLSNLSQDFPHKKHYLNLFSFYIKQGNIYAIIAAHNASFMRQIFDEIIKVPGDLGLSYGQMVLPSIESSLQQKYEFYCQYLRSLMIWAICLPKNEVGDVSDLKKMYNNLQHDLCFEFPQVVMLEIIIGQFTDNLNRRQFQNDEILRMMDEDENLFSEIDSMKMKSDVTEYKQTITTMKQLPQESRVPIKQTTRKQTIRERREPVKVVRAEFINKVIKELPQQSRVPVKVKLQHQNDQNSKKNEGQDINQSFDSLLKEVQNNLNHLRQADLVAQNIVHLREFKRDWQELQQAYDEEVSPQTKQKGDKYCQKIEALSELYQKVEKQEMSFRIFNQKVNLILESQIKSTPPNSHKYRQYEQIEKISIHSNRHSRKDSPGGSRISLKFQSNCSDNPKPKYKHQKVSSTSQKKDPSQKCQRQMQMKEQKIIIHQVNSKKLNIKKFQQVKPLAYNQYGIQNMLTKKKQVEQTNSQCSSRSGVKIQSRILPSEMTQNLSYQSQPSQLVKSETLEKMSYSEGPKINADNSKLKSVDKKQSIFKRPSLILSSRRSVISSNSKNSRDRVSNCLNFDKVESSVRKIAPRVDEQQKQVQINDEVQEVYQMCLQRPEADSNTPVKGQTNSPQLKGFARGGMSFQKMIHTLTTRSIQSYRYSVGRTATNQSRSSSRNNSAQVSNSFSRSIIRKQYDRIKPKQKSQRKQLLQRSIQYTINRSDAALLPSDLLKSYSKQNTSKKGSNTSYELVTKKLLHLFPTKQHNKIVKNCLQSKGLLYESKQIQVGYVHFLKDNHLDFTIFLTAQSNLDTVKLKIEGDQNLSINFENNEITNLCPGQQEAIKISTSLMNIPFRMPCLRIIIKQQRQKRQNIISLPLPCSINKYSIFQSISEDLLSKLTLIEESMQKFRTYSFKIMRKLQKSANISKYFPFFSSVKGQEGSISYFTQYKFRGQRGLVELVNEEKQGWHVVGRCQAKESNFMEFVLGSFFFLLEE